MATKTGKELELRVAQAYRQMGARKVEHDVELSGHQIDVYVELETADRALHRIAVEAKDYNSPVGIAIIRDFSSIVDRLRRKRLIDEGVIVSTAGFSKQAREAAQTDDIRLLTPEDLDQRVADAMREQATRGSTYVQLKLQTLRVEEGAFDNKTIQVIVTAALGDSDPYVRVMAADFVEEWSETSKREAAQFESQLRRMSRHDSDVLVRERAMDAAKRFAIIDGGRIDLELFKVADAYRKIQVLQKVSQRIGDFDAETIRMLIDCALHDVDPLIRGTACELLQKLAASDVWKWAHFEPQVRRITLHDPSLFVYRQAAAVAQKLYWPAAVQRWGLTVLLCAVLAVILSLVAFSMIANALPASWAIIPPSCDEHPYAHSVVQATGTENASYAIGSPDGAYASVGLEANSVLTLDMGQDTPIVTGPGVDFYYYERPYDPGIWLDAMQISVAQDDGSGSPDPNSFEVVFVWGDDDPTNNGSIPPGYFEDGEEEPNIPIESAALYNETAIGIDIGGDERTAYRYVRIQTYPPDAPASDPELLTEVDAVERVCQNVSPVLECVEEGEGGVHVAHFGYVNPYNVAVPIPIGSNNEFHPPPADRGQPTEFKPGRHRDVFAVGFDGSNLVWELDDRTSAASSDFERCLTPVPAQGNRIVIQASPDGARECLVRCSDQPLGADILTSLRQYLYPGQDIVPSSPAERRAGQGSSLDAIALVPTPAPEPMATPTLRLTPTPTHSPTPAPPPVGIVPVLQSLLGSSTFLLVVASWALMIALLLWRLRALRWGERKLRERERELSADPEAAAHPADEIRQRHDHLREEIDQLRRKIDLIRDSGRDVPWDRTLELNNKIAQYEEDEELLKMIRYSWEEV